MDYGVAGLFIFQSKKELSDVPEEGEFVRWLQEKKTNFFEIKLEKTKEYGLLSEYKKLPEKRCRPFNQIKEEKGVLIKEGISKQGKELAVREQEWYKHVKDLGVYGIPYIHSFVPLCMEKIDGKNIFEYHMPKEEKQHVLVKIINMLEELHKKERMETD